MAPLCVLGCAERASENTKAEFWARVACGDMALSEATSGEDSSKALDALNDAIQHAQRASRLDPKYDFLASNLEAMKDDLEGSRQRAFEMDLASARAFCDELKSH